MKFKNLKIKQSPIALWLQKQSLILITIILTSASLNQQSFAEENHMKETSPENLVIEKILCEGNKITKCEHIKQKITLKTGERIEQERIESERLKLVSLGLFASVNIKLKKGSKRGKVALIIVVEEESPYFAFSKLSGFLSNKKDSSAIAKIKAGYKNLFGTGKVLQIEAERNEQFSADSVDSNAIQLTYLDPNIAGSERFYYSLGLGYVASSFFDDELFDDSHIYAETTLGLRFNDYSFFDLRYLYADVDDLSFNPTLFLFGQHNLLASIGWNSEDDVFFPTSGDRFIFSLGYNLDIQSFVSAELGYRIHWKLNDKSSMSANLGDTRSREDSPFQSKIDNEITAWSLGYNYDWKKAQTHDSIKTGRIYSQIGLDSIAFSNSFRFNPAAKLGVRMDTKSFGIVDLSFLYRAE